MEAMTIGEGAEPIESIEWLHEFDRRYMEAWNSQNPAAVAACTHPDVIWIDPALAEPARGPRAVAEFAASSVAALPDLTFTQPGAIAISEDSGAAYVPWTMSGTNSGPIDPPGLAATGRSIEIRGFDIWQFREGSIWRYEAIYDFAEMARQLGLMPPRGGAAERAMITAQRLRAKLRF